MSTTTLKNKKKASFNLTRDSKELTTTEENFSNNDNDQQQGIIYEDTTNLSFLITKMNQAKNIENTHYCHDEERKAFVDDLKKVNKNFLIRVWYSLMENHVAIKKPKSFSSLNVEKLSEALFDIRVEASIMLEKIYNDLEVLQYINCHSISESNTLYEKPTRIGTLVNICKKIQNNMVRIGKACIIENSNSSSDSLNHNDEMVRMVIIELVYKCKLVHNDTEFRVGAILDWNWKYLAKHIATFEWSDEDKPIKRSSEDFALGTTLRRRIISNPSPPPPPVQNGSSSERGGNNGARSTAESIELVNCRERIGFLEKLIVELRNEKDTLKRKRESDLLVE